MSALLFWTLLALTLTLAVAGMGWAFRRAKKNAAAVPGLPAQGLQTTPQAHAAPPSLADLALAAPLFTEPLPPELASLSWRREADLSASRRGALLASMAGVTRPPGPLLQLLHTDFVAQVSTTELSDLIMAEPLVAAKLLGQVNAPLYGLRRPVTDIAQAVALLGMATVRSIGVQHMLAQAFEPTDVARQRVLDTLWRTSTLASELSARLGKALNLPDQGALPTRVVLGFVGPVVTASLLPLAAVGPWLALAPAQRAAHEQAVLGLSSGEMGVLLMASWGLPPALTAEVGGASRLLGQSADATDPATAPRLALSYLCMHLGERLASGQLTCLADHDLMQAGEVATHHLRRYLQQPSLHLRSYLGSQPAQRLQAALQAPELLAALRQMQAPMPAA